MLGRLNTVRRGILQCLTENILELGDHLVGRITRGVFL